MTKSSKASIKGNIAKPVETTKTQAMRIIKAGSCSTISGKSTLHYHIACNQEDALYVRVTSNNGGGFFNPEWVGYTEIISTLQGMSEPITSNALRCVFQGKSANNPAFLMAILMQEGIVIANPDYQRAYLVADNSAFIQAMQKLMQSDIKIKDALASDEVPRFAESQAA